MTNLSILSILSSFTVMHWLTLLIVFLSGRLAIEMWHRETMPIFRLYLIGLVVGLTMLDTHGNPWIELAVLMLKCAATAEVLGILCSDAEEAEMCWICLFSAGAAGVMCCLLMDYNRQLNLLYADLRYVKHICQVVLLLVTLCITLFAWVAYELRGWQIKHAMIMCALWLDYAVVGILAPKTQEEWVRGRNMWCIGAIVCLAGWYWALASSGEQTSATVQYLPHASPESGESS